MMKKTIQILFKKSLLLAAVVSISYAQIFTIDAAASELKWKAEKVTGKHHGGLKVKSGTIQINKNKIVKGTVIADLTTIQDFDITSDTHRLRLENHLKSSDFFAADSFPNAIFTFGSGISLGDDKYKINGSMEIKGMSRPVEFEAKITWDMKKALATGTITLDRSKWDIRYRSGSFFENLGDKAINDDFNVDFNLVGELIKK